MKRKAVSGIIRMLFFVGMFTMSFNVKASQSATIVRMGVYWDSSCVEPVSSVYWGSVRTGSSKNITVIVRNEGNVAVTLSLESSNWNPPEVANYITLTWNYTEEILAPPNVVPITLSLYASVFTEEIYAVTFDAKLIIKPIDGLTTWISVPMAAFLSRTWTVDDDGPADFHTIQEAINAANPGDTVYVFNGAYYENLVVNETVMLVGEDKSTTVIDGNGTGPCVYITADNVTFTRFTVQESRYGIVLDNSSGTLVSDNFVSRNNWGIYTKSDNNLIVRNVIVKNLDGIHLRGSLNTVSQNNLSSNSFAVYTYMCEKNTIIGNEVSNGLWGIELVHSGCSMVVDNKVSGNDFGIGLTYCSNNTIYGNSFINNENQVFILQSYNNTWDKGYPSGGNYWDDYTGADFYSGLYQNETGSDGIGDIPYIIDEKNQDRYPLMPRHIVATVDIDPGTLNLKSRARWITACIELPEGYDVSEIDLSTIMLNGTISVDTRGPIAIGDYDRNGIPDLTVKFNRVEVVTYISDAVGTSDRFSRVFLTATGKLSDFTSFAGKTATKIIYKSQKN